MFLEIVLAVILFVMGEGRSGVFGWLRVFKGGGWGGGGKGVEVGMGEGRCVEG